MKKLVPVAIAVATFALSGCAEPAALPTLPALPTLTPVASKPTPSKSPSDTASRARLNASKIDKDLRASLGLKRWTDACKAAPDGWPCVVSDVQALSASTLLITLQIADKDTRLGQAAWKSIDLMLEDHPEVVGLQVNNAVGQVLANGVR